MWLSRRLPAREAGGDVHGRNHQQMGIATRGAEVKRRGNRFSIRWDDGRRTKRLLPPLVAVLIALAAAPAAWDDAR